MALFTDGPASSLEDLQAQDSQALQVASAEGIDLTVKLGLAHESVGMEVEELLRRTDAAFGVAQVVVTPALRLWHTYRTLENVYRDAYNSQLNDRYAGKRDQFHELGRWAYERLLQAGIGIALRPVPRAATPVLEQMTFGGLPDDTYFVTIAWVNGSGQEGASATPAVITTAGGSFVVSPGPAPEGAAGWNAYVGTAPESMRRQNPSLLGTGQFWMQPDALAAGAAPPDGQKANYYHAVPRVLQRG